jgi:hypothetical protein
MTDAQLPWEEQATQAIDMAAVLAEGRWRRIVAETRSRPNLTTSTPQ